MISRRVGSHLSRYRQIAEVLARHGLGFLVDVTGLGRFVPLHFGPLRVPGRGEPVSRPARLRLALAELGTTFIKLGQILSTRGDLLPQEYVSELSKLQDQGPIIPPEEILAIVTDELGRPVDEVFASFNLEPLAAASIGQVHLARLLDGTEVVVKVRRPNVEQQVAQDLEILQNLAATTSRHWELADEYDVVGLVEEFAQTLRGELDYVREGHSAEQVARNFAGDNAIHIPRVYWEQTTTRILTLERIRGIKINDPQALEAAGIDRQALARRAARALFKMTLEDGFFHADPHPGNFLIEPDGRIGLIDFGMMGTLDQHTRDQLIEAVLAVGSRDSDRMVDSLLALRVARHRVNRPVLRRDLEHLVSRYYGRPLGELEIAPLIDDSLALVRRHHLQLPAGLALLAKTAMMSEGLGRQVDPSFRLPQTIVPYARRLVIQQYSPQRIARVVGQATLDLARLGVELPEQVRRIVSELEHGGIEVGVRPEGFDPLIRRFERLANRIVLGIIVAAFVNGLAVLVSVYHPAAIDRWAGLAFAVGFAFAAIIGVYLAWSILRSGRG